MAPDLSGRRIVAGVDLLTGVSDCESLLAVLWLLICQPTETSADSARPVVWRPRADRSVRLAYFGVL